ncbi:MAG: hypothetical protein ACO3A2_08240 [Bdellovibrionia bacterium]
MQTRAPSVPMTYYPPSVLPSTPSPSAPIDYSASFNYSFRLQNTTKAATSCTNPTPTGVQVGSYQTPEIKTDNRFMVQIRAGAPSNVPCTGFLAAYSCLQMKVTVGSDSRTVLLPYGSPPAGSPCANAPTQANLDFSSQATPGHDTLSVRISEVQSDNCRQFGYPQQSGCFLSPLFTNFIAAGSITILTN